MTMRTEKSSHILWRFKGGQSEIEKLLRKEAIRLHRKMWNWIADKEEKGNNVGKWEFICIEELPIVDSDCFCCEYACQKAEENGEEYEYRCKYCPLEWDNANKNLLFMCCDNEVGGDDEGLYYQWRKKSISLEEKAKIARQIANLPERKETADENQI